MQTSDILISLRGDHNNVVPKSAVTVPEVLVIMAGHGQHSVTLVPGTIEESRGISHAAELARLSSFYGAEPAEACFGKPTFNTKLPTTFFEVGLSEVPEVKEKEDRETPTERKKRIAAEKAFAALEAEAKAKPDIGASASDIGGAFSQTPGEGSDPEDPAFENVD